MSEMKPCPFCGSEVQDDERGEKYPKKSPMGGWIIHCECCGASLSQFRKSGKGEISWNTRPIEDALNARIAELEAENDYLTAQWRQEPQDYKSSNDTQTDTFVYGKDSKPIPCPFCGEIVKECNDVTAAAGGAGMSEMSDMFKLVNQMELAKKARVGTSLTYFDVIELLGEIKSLYEYIDELEAERRWRVVADGEMPEDRATVLVAFKNREILTATYYKRYEGFGGVDNWWNIEGWHSGNVTHWMPLPQPPEVQQ